MQRRLFLWIALALIPAVTGIAEPPEPPAWFTDHIRFMAGGTWLTDNEPYMGDDEPSVTYGTEWTLGIGDSHLRGRLFGVGADGGQTVFWEYQVFWHPGERTAMMLQFGAGGAIGIGPLWRQKDGTIRSEMTFHYPGGVTMRIAHDLVESPPGTHITRSFHWNDGEWKPQRTYSWERQ